MSTGIPQFMAARALAVTGGNFRDALTFVHDNVDQPPEFWQAEAERQESRPLSVESQLLCLRLQSSSDELATAAAGTSAGGIVAAGSGPGTARATKEGVPDALGFDELRVGDHVLIDAAACDEAVRARLKKHEFDATKLPTTMQLPQWRPDDEPSDFLSFCQPTANVPWRLSVAGTVDVECTLPLVRKRWQDCVDESIDLVVSVLPAADLFPSGDAAVPLSSEALERLARTAPSAVVLPFDCVQSVRAHRAWRQLQSAVSEAAGGVRVLVLERGSTDVPEWLDSDAKDALSTLLVVSLPMPDADPLVGTAAPLGRQACVAHRHGAERWAEGSVATLAVATESHTLVLRPFGGEPKCDGCKRQITGPGACKKDASETAGVFLPSVKSLMIIPHGMLAPQNPRLPSPRPSRRSTRRQ